MSRLDDDALRLLRTFEHDLTVPVSNILGYASLLLEDEQPLTQDQADIVHRMEQNCQTILSLLKQFVAARQAKPD